MNLTIAISTVEDVDFDDLPITIKMAASSLDEKPVNFTTTHDASALDADIKTVMRTKLTALGYTWDTET